MTDSAADAIAATARNYLTAHCDFARLREVFARPQGWDAALWAGFGRELGFAGLVTAEAHGGAGLGVREAVAVAEAVGAHLPAIPWFESAVLVPGVVQAAGGHAGLASIAAGSVATLAWREGATLPVIERGVLRGAAPYVPFGAVAEHVLVAAQEGNGVSLVLLPADATGVTRQALTSLDLTRPLAALEFHGVAVHAYRVGAPGTGLAAIDGALPLASVVLAAEAVGGMARSLDEALAYARQRVQFGRTIGSFQAIKHRFADMKLQLEAARSALAWAVDAVAAGGGQVEAAGALAFCADAFHALAGDAIQLHGGIGFTWDHHAHLFFKRARGAMTLLRTPASGRAAVAAHLLPEFGEHA